MVEFTDVSPIMDVALNWVGLAVIGVFSIAAAVGIVVLTSYIRRYNTPTYIFYKDALDNLQIKKDTGGIYTDKRTKQKLFFLRGHKVGLRPDRIPYLTMGKQKLVWLYQHGLKNFAYIQPKVSNPEVTLTVTEEDFNWYLHDKAKYSNLFQKDQFMQYIIAVGMFAVSAMMILILIFMVLKRFDVLESVASALVQAAEEVAKARTGTAVVTP